MKKRSDKILALLLCAFMAFSFIAAAVEPAAAAETETAEVPPVETAATTETTELTEDPGETPTDAEAPAETPTETEAPAETPAAEETPAATETPAETPAATETPAETEAPAETQAPAEEPKEPETTVELKTAEFNGDAAGMNFTVSGDLPVGGKLQVTAIDPSCNDYIVDTYLNGLELPEGTQTAFELSILTKDQKPFSPSAGSKLTITMSSNDGAVINDMGIYYLPQVTAAQILGAVKTIADAQAAGTYIAPEPAQATDAQGKPIRHYEEMNVDHYDSNGKRFFQFDTTGLSTYYIVADLVPAEAVIQHTDGCTGDGCTLDGCPCQCHSLYSRLMACTTLEEIDALLESATEEELAALTEGQNRQINALIEALEPEPLPAVVLKNSEDEPVAGEIIYPTVNYSWVAPFGSPVVG